MSHVYEVHTSDGQVHHVETDHHHDHHDERTFVSHLFDVIKGAAGGFLSATITRYVYRGRR
ncbi:hypothetical protein [Sphingopyxis sp. GC21]|uniref:hypothetical protein n=1 Tax=Sphingopyxis sp. GC21 TaxID=2933562 RepID=UPI0021E3CBB5|nr:hypothetical protein [Sphingopyxis sp. GC21]